MALGVERDVIGDILVGEGRCVAFFRQEMGALLPGQHPEDRPGGRNAEEGAKEPLPVRREFKELSGVVASQRLDCLVAFLCKTSREKAAGLITAGLVMRNHREKPLPVPADGGGGRALLGGTGNFRSTDWGP